MNPTTLPIILSAALLLSASGLMGATKVYKKVLPDGSISYSDEPTAGSEAITVEPVATVPALKIPSTVPTNTDNAAESKSSLNYSSLVITAPEDNSAFNSGSGTVNIVYTSSPSLRPGDKYKVFLGRELVAEHTGTNITLNNVDRGTHIISVNIVDRSGQVLTSTSSTFTIHRPIQ